MDPQLPTVPETAQMDLDVGTLSYLEHQHAALLHTRTALAKAIEEMESLEAEVAKEVRFVSLCKELEFVLSHTPNT